MSKKISVIIPAYNVENYLKECLDSVIGQDNGQIEIILVDDGSQDSTPKLCEEYSAKYPIIRYFAKENEGLSATRNFGIKQAEGEYIIFLDSDDLLAENAVKNITEIIDEKKPDNIIGRYLDLDDLSGTQTVCGYALEKQRAEAAAGEELLCCLLDNRMYDWYACINIIRRDFLLENGLFFEQGVTFEDARWTPYVMLRSQNTAYLEQPFYVYRRNRPGSITATFSVNNFSSKLGVLDFMDYFCTSCGLGESTRIKMFANMANLYVSMLFDSWYFPKKERNDHLRKLKPYKFILKNSVRTYHRLLFAFWSVFGVKLTSYILYLRAAKIRKAAENRQ